VRERERERERARAAACVCVSMYVHIGVCVHLYIFIGVCVYRCMYIGVRRCAVEGAGCLVRCLVQILKSSLIIDLCIAYALGRLLLRVFVFVAALVRETGVGCTKAPPLYHCVHRG
jgi:hypothetical protein